MLCFRGSSTVRARSSRLLLPRLPTTSTIRHFHYTRQAQLIPEVLAASSTFLHGVHSLTGLPWAASIPLAAVIVRSIVAFPLQAYARVHRRREQDLLPVVQCWRMLYEETVRKEILEDNDHKRDRSQQAFWKSVRALTERKHRHLKRRWNVIAWTAGLPLLQIPIWLSLMEALRAMCGDRRGLLAYFLHNVYSEDHFISLLPAVEPTLATEGALWFPDLLAGDPSGILPAMLTGTILLNIIVGWRRLPMGKIAQMPAKQMRKEIAFTGLRYFIQILAFNIGIAAYTYGMPTGLMIYWIASGNMATLQTLILDRVMFLKPMEGWRKMYIGVEDAGKANSVAIKWIPESSESTSSNGSRVLETKKKQKVLEIEKEENLPKESKG